MGTIALPVDGDQMVVDCFDAAAPANLPVLLIHGWGGSGRNWSATIERLSDRFDMLVPDLLGFGRSVPVQRGRDIFDQVDALEMLLAHLQISRAHVVGHSAGGAVALVLAARRPELVERLALTSVGLFRSAAERNIFNAVMGLTGAFMRLRGAWMADIPFLVQQSARRYFFEIPDDPELLRAGLLDYLHMDYATALASARSAVSDAIPEAARHIQAPTLLIAAREDQSMPPANVEYTATVIPNCAIHWIERCGHLPMVERPDEYAAALGTFLDSETTGES